MIDSITARKNLNKQLTKIWDAHCEKHQIIKGKCKDCVLDTGDDYFESMCVYLWDTKYWLPAEPYHPELVNEAFSRVRLGWKKICKNYKNCNNEKNEPCPLGETDDSAGLCLMFKMLDKLTVYNASKK